MKQKKVKIRVLFAGSSWLTATTLSAGTSFAYDLRGVSVENTVERILAAWRKNPRLDVTYMTGWDALAKFPEALQDLGHYDVILLSDVDSDSLVLYPVDRLLHTPMGPNRLKCIREFVRRGGGLLMVGGYYSFTGRHNAGNYHHTPVEEALPINCLALDDDRVEAPEGITIEVKKRQHPVMQGIRWSPSPMFTGYNRLEVKTDAEVLATVKETGDPIIVVWNYGKGKSMAFASGIGPHWGSSFQQWRFSQRFLEQALEWLSSR